MKKITSDDIYKMADLYGDPIEWARYYVDGAGIAPPVLTSSRCPMHDFLAANALTRFLTVIAPRGHAKTTVGGFIVPLWLLCNARDDDGGHLFNFFLYVTNDYREGSAFFDRIRDHIQNNHRIHRDYGIKPGTPWNQGDFYTNTGVRLKSTGIHSVSKGLISRTGKRPDYIILDDIYADAKINADFLKIGIKVADVITSLPPRDSDHYCIHKISTAVHTTDVNMRDRDSAGVVFKSFPAFGPDYVAHDDGTVSGTKLWPDGFPDQNVAAIRAAVDEITWQREYMCAIVSSDESIIRPEWIQLYSDLPNSKTQVTYIAVDPAISKNSSADYTAKIVFKILDRNFYIVDIIIGRQSMLENAAHISDMVSAHGAKFVVIESISAFAGLAELVENAGIKIVPIKSKPDKITVRQNKSVFFQQGRVFINEKIQKRVLDETISQLVTNEPQPHDDIADAIFSGLSGDIALMTAI